jgi:hypothetical protein
MNPFTYISNISRNSQSNLELINGINNEKFNSNSLCISPEIIALIVFACIYIIIRLIETYITPSIPYFFKSELSSLFRWGPILIPIIFSITYFSQNNKKTINPIRNLNGNNVNNISDDTILKERMMLWTKK